MTIIFLASKIVNEQHSKKHPPRKILDITNHPIYPEEVLK
jgi:hypothetical protein